VLNTRESIKFEMPGGQAAEVRWPTDQEWIDRAKRTRGKIKLLAGGRTAPVPADPDVAADADLALFKAIAASTDFDEDTALRVIGILDNGRLVSVTPEGSLVVVTMDVLGSKGVAPFRVTFTFNRPSMRQERAYKAKGSVMVADKGGATFEAIPNYQFQERLYAELIDQTEGYDGPVPLTHKLAALAAAMSVDSEDEQDEAADELGF
jgi:hypothetical protein